MIATRRRLPVFLRLTFVGALVASMLLPAPPAHALFHLMKITEIFAGTSTAPDAQFIELQMHADNQRFVATHEVVVFDSTGAEEATFTFTSAMQNGASQSHVLVATPAAEEMFGVAADLEMDPSLSANGGKACFRSNQGELIDCASWGGYSGSNEGSGTPFNAPLGLTGDRSMTRDISGGDDPNALDAADDTNDSAADFDFASPGPTNNSGASAGVTDHDRRVTLTLGGRGKLVASGRVSAEGDFEGCFADVPVKLQRRRSGRFVTIKGTRSGA
ncbi:MAG: hypothetical protein M3238_04385, partial [Actinomycetota bacterium]|nr:hypothetical protein [Actinomycetota bacterium]